MKRILFFDTETNGLPARYHAPYTDTASWPRLLQLAWELWDYEPGKEPRQVRVGNQYILPKNFELDTQAAQVHGLTAEVLTEKGNPISAALWSFLADVSHADQVVAHNADFDHQIVMAEIYRQMLAGNRCGQGAFYFLHIPIACTMRQSVDFCQIPSPKNPNQYKWPKLQELYRALFGEFFEGAHDASKDIAATARCFFKLVELGVIKWNS